ELAAGVIPQYFLDANGEVTVPITDLYTSATDNCSVTVSAGGATSGGQETLNLGFAGGNGNFGTFFTINALEDITVDSFDANMQAGSPVDVVVYYKEGTHVGFETDQSAWTLVGEAPGTAPNGEGVPTPLDLDMGVEIGNGQTGSFYVTAEVLNGGFAYTNGTGVGNIWASDDNLEMLEGTAVGGFFTGSLFQPRVFNGNIIYSVGGGGTTTDLTFTCEDVGIVDVVVTATDSSGNETSCVTQLEIIDNIAPVLVCQDIDLSIGEDGTVTLDPMDLLDMDNTVEACGLDIVTADITQFDCSDIGSEVEVTVFVEDVNGNIASCTAMVTIVDTVAPVVTCPDDLLVDPEPNGLYTLEDFIASGEASAVDNCSEDVTLTQTPAPGTQLGVGTYTITITAEDEFGNVGTC
ncbi:HYR domain-containing protein, partial [Planktosalinus lacus]|uniref:HYR domain-containing protein n=1 Tax=Planktosalinus lacus TaxID=1526573 RepID=UPI00166EE5F3